jgi:hypothetical protein
MYVLTKTSEGILHEKEGKIKREKKANQPQITIASLDAAASVQLTLHDSAYHPLHRVYIVTP